MKTKLSKSWMPSENVLSLAKSKGMPIEDWLYHLIPEFKLYWLERNILRCWDATFWNHAKKEWEKVDKSRMYRETFSKETRKLAQQVVDMPLDTESVGVWAERLAKDLTPITPMAMTPEKRLAFADLLSKINANET